MAMPGWYPDPAGASGRYRYWNGQSWSQVTTADPTEPAPTPALPGGADGSQAPRRKAAPWLLAVAVLLVLAVAGVFVVRAVLGNRDTIVDSAPLPSSTVSGWDDSSPTEPSDPSASPQPTPTPSSPAEQVPCPQGDPTARQPHPEDGRLHGGGLSIPRQKGWDGPSPSGALSWAYDVEGQTKQIEPRWIAMLGVGALFTGDGFDEPRRAAEMVMQCTVTSPFYIDFRGRKDLWSKAVTVDGRPGWSLRSEIRIENPDIYAEGDIVEVTVVDAGSPESLGMFLGAVPIGDEVLIKTMDQTVKDLRVE